MWAVRRFLSWCESLWYPLTNRSVPCATVIHCWISNLNIINYQLIVNSWFGFRREAVGGKTVTVLVRGSVWMKVSQHKLRSCIWKLFIPGDMIVFIFCNITVHDDRVSLLSCQYWRVLCEYFNRTDTCKLITNVKNLDFIPMTLREEHVKSEMCNLHDRTVRRV